MPRRSREEMVGGQQTGSIGLTRRLEREFGNPYAEGVLGALQMLAEHRDNFPTLPKSAIREFQLDAVIKALYICLLKRERNKEFNS